MSSRSTFERLISSIKDESPRLREVTTSSRSGSSTRIQLLRNPYQLPQTARNTGPISVTAKNYLGPEDIDTLNRITVMFLDQAEFRAQRRQDLHMSEWEMFLDKLLRDLDLPVLTHVGTVRHEDAASWAKEQYAAFSDRRRLEAEGEAETRYVEDLRTSAKMLEAGRENSAMPKKTAKRSASKRKLRKGNGE